MSSPAPYLVRARRASRVLVTASLLAGRLPSRARTPLVLGVLALGMPHGAADTELLRVAAAGSRRRLGALMGGYAGAAAVGTAVIAHGSPAVSRVVLAGTAAHFAEGELACWPAAAQPGGAPVDRALRVAGAALATTLLPALVGRDGLRDSDRTARVLLREPGPRRRGLLLAGGASLAAAGALAVRGDRVAAADLALLTMLDLVTPPPVTFAAYFGGWHSLRHTGRVLDALAAAGELPADLSLPVAGLQLARRSAWAAGVGLVAAGALAARDPRRAGDRALVGVLGLTLPHAATVALRLRRRLPVQHAER